MPEIWGQDPRSGILRWLGSGKEVQRDIALPLRLPEVHKTDNQC